MKNYKLEINLTKIKIKEIKLDGIIFVLIKFFQTYNFHVD